MAAAGRVYEQFEPSTSWKHEDACDTLVLGLPGFMKQNLRVQITSQGKLRVIGERQLGGNKWDHFTKEFPIATDCDVSKITAKFENAELKIRLPKEITSVPPQTKTAEKPAEPAKAKPDETESAKNHEQKTNQEIASKARQDEADDTYEKRSGDQGEEEKDEIRHESRSEKSTLERYKQAAGGMVPQMRRPKLVHIVLVVCWIMVLGYYVRNVYRFFRPFNDE